MLVQEHIAHLLTPQVPPGWDEEMRNFFDSQRSEEGTLQTGLAATDSEENEGFEAADDADLSHKADEDEDDSEGEEAEDEQTPPSNGNIKKREVNYSSEYISRPSSTHNSFICMVSADRVLRSPMTESANRATLHLKNLLPRDHPLS